MKVTGGSGRVGTIDQRAELAPGLQVWCRSKLDWVGGVEQLPAMDRR